MVKLDAPLNAFVPMLSTLFGMVMEVKADAFENALAPMLLRLEPLSNVTSPKLDAFENASAPLSFHQV